MSLPRTLVLGWDGATPGWIEAGLRAGELPNLAALRASVGPLRSTRPPMTLPAWSSFLTGAAPGVHGIVDFTTREDGRLRFLDARDRAVPTLLERLDAAGLRVGSFLFPATWPPSPLSGGCISGFDSPVATTVPGSACAPRALHGLIDRTLGRGLSYAAFSELRKGRRWEERAASSLLAGIADKERVALALLRERGPFDVFAMLFGESDTAGHHFWHLADERSIRHEPGLASAFGGVLAAVYRRLDGALGRIVDAGGFEAGLLASDHGFGPASDRVVHLNAWLHRQGWLRWSGASVAPVRRAAVSALPPGLLDRAVRALPGAWLGELEDRARSGHLVAQETTFFSDELNYAPGLWFGDRRPGGRRPSEADVQRLLAQLKGWRDPFDGEPVVRAVYRAAEAFPGPHANRAQDLLLDLRRPRGTYNLLASRPGDPPLRRLRRSERRGVKGGGMAGSHRELGVWAWWGRGAPPEGEERAIAELLPAYLAAHAVQPPELVRGRGAAGTSAPDRLASRLRDLGYLP